MNYKLHIKAFLGLSITLLFEHLFHHPKTWEGLIWVNLLSLRKPAILSQVKIEMKTKSKQNNISSCLVFQDALQGFCRELLLLVKKQVPLSMQLFIWKTPDKLE